MSVKFLLLCGYRGTGKDTFVDEILFREENWCIYGKEGSNYEEVYKMRSRLGLADSVKKQVAQQLGLPFSISQVDKLKDVMVISGKKLREWINEYTTKKAMEDKFYWEKMAMKLVEEDRENDNEYIISDFRYRRTYEFFSDNKGGVLTARLFRADNNIPDKKEKTEHILDDFTTDFLLVPRENSEEHFNKCIKILSQYNDYKLLYKPEVEKRSEGEMK